MADGDDHPFVLDRNSPVAIHAQISDWMRTRIASGVWPAHYRVKAEPVLAEYLGVSRGTLRRALTTLISEGLLVQVQGRGTFVTSTVIEPSIAQKLSTLTEDFAGQGIEVTTQVIEQRIIEAPQPVVALLDAAGERVMKLVRLRASAQGPAAFLINFVRADLAPGIEKKNFSELSLFGVLENDYGLKIGSGRRTFSAQPANEMVAEHLNLAVGDPVQYLEQVTYLADGHPIEYSDVWINSNLLRVASVLER